MKAISLPLPPLPEMAHGHLAIHTASSSLPNFSGAPTEHCQCLVVPVVIAQTLTGAQESTLPPRKSTHLPRSRKSFIHVSLVFIHRNHLCLWRLTWETMLKR